MKKIMSKHHARTKSDNQFVNISKLSNFDEEQYNTTSRDLTKIIVTAKQDLSKEKQSNKNKFLTNQKEELCKIEENPSETNKNPKHKSRSLNTISVRKTHFLINNNNQSKEEITKEDKNLKQIKITVKYYRKKVNPKPNEKVINPQSISKVFNIVDNPSTQRNSIKSSNLIVSEIKRPFDSKQFKQINNGSPNKLESLLKSPTPNALLTSQDTNHNLNVKDFNKETTLNLGHLCRTSGNGISAISNSESSQSVRQSIVNSNGTINILQITPYRVIDLTDRTKPKQMKINYLSQSSNNKTTISQFNSSSNKSTPMAKPVSTSRVANQGGSVSLQGSTGNDKIGYSYIKVAKKDYSSHNALDTARDNMMKNSINIIDVKKQLKKENEQIKNKKIWSSKTNSSERNKNNLKFNYESNNKRHLNKSILSSVGKQIEAYESETKNFSKTNSKESLSIVKNDSVKNSQFNLLMNNLKNCENGGSYKFISNLTSSQGFNVDNILGDIYKETFAKNSHIHINANYVPKKYLRDTTNEIRDDSLEHRKSRINANLQEEENEEISSSDKTLLIDELNTRIIPNDFMKFQKPSVDFNKFKGENRVKNEIMCEYEVSKEFEENCFNSGEEKEEKITKLPLFKSKQLSLYNSDPHDFKKKYHSEPGNTRYLSFLFQNTSFKTIMKLNRSVKQNLFNFLSFNDLIRLSMCSKFIKKETNTKIYDLLINLIVNQNNVLLRLKIWKSLFRHSDLNHSNLHRIYSTLSKKESPYEEEIKKDLLRTLPDDPTFKYEKINYKKLYNILRAYSNYNTNIGYAQGLNFIVANCIFVLNDEEEVFIFLDSFIRKFNLVSMMGMENNSVRKKLLEIEKIIKKFIPDLIKFLEANYLNHEFFTTQWVITIFANSVKPYNLFRIWDFAIIYGWKFLNYLIVSILLTFKNIIINYDVNHLSPFMKNLLKSDLFDQAFLHIITMTFDMLNEYE